MVESSPDGQQMLEEVVCVCVCMCISTCCVCVCTGVYDSPIGCSSAPISQPCQTHRPLLVGDGLAKSIRSEEWGEGRGMVLAKFALLSEDRDLASSPRERQHKPRLTQRAQSTLAMLLETAVSLIKKKEICHCGFKCHIQHVLSAFFC